MFEVVSLDMLITIVAAAVVALGTNDEAGVRVRVGVSEIEGSKTVSLSGWSTVGTDMVGDTNVVWTAVVIMEIVTGGVNNDEEMAKEFVSVTGRMLVGCASLGLLLLVVGCTCVKEND